MLPHFGQKIAVVFFFPKQILRTDGPTKYMIQPAGHQRNVIISHTQLFSLGPIRRELRKRHKKTWKIPKANLAEKIIDANILLKHVRKDSE
jgi:hypothetical protein